MQALYQLQAAGGVTITEKGSKFIAYAVRATNIDEVRKAQLHFKWKYSNATHVITVYRLMGTNKAYDEDYYNDGEHGARGRVLNLLHKENIQNTAVFLIRFYGGTHLGPRRFEIMADLTKKVCNRLNTGDTFTSKLPLSQMLCAPHFKQVKGRNKTGLREHHSVNPRGGYAGLSCRKATPLQPRFLPLHLL